MSIEVYQVKGDIMELIFDPRAEDLRVGETLTVQERDTGQGLVVQILEFRMVTYPSLVQELLRMVLGQSHNGHPNGHNGVGNNPEETLEMMTNLTEALSSEDTLNVMQLSQERNLKIAVCKIRKLTGSAWDQWDGWIPHRDVVITRTADAELFENCVADLGNHLDLGFTLRGEPFTIEGQTIEKINIVTGVKGSGKSHLSKVLLLELIRAGAPCIVFDLNKEYIHLPPHEVDDLTGRVVRRGIIHLKAGANLKLGLRQFGIQPLITMLEKYGLPEVSCMHLENRLFGLFEEMDYLEKKGMKVPFIGIEHLIEMAEHNEIAPNEVVNAAIRSRLLSVRNTGVFATKPEEAIDLRQEYKKVRFGGALVIDVSALSNLARFGFTQAILEIVKSICEEEIQSGTARFPFVFFEEAHLYISRNTITNIVTRSRHLGITCFFITNMVGGLDESVLRQADNLFMTYLPFDDDVRHIGKSAMTDQETMSSFVKRLRRHHAMVIGTCTRQYPIIIKVKALRGINTAGETQYFFKPKMNGNGANGAESKAGLFKGSEKEG